MKEYINHAFACSVFFDALTSWGPADPGDRLLPRLANS